MLMIAMPANNYCNYRAGVIFRSDGLPVDTVGGNCYAVYISSTVGTPHNDFVFFSKYVNGHHYPLVQVGAGVGRLTNRWISLTLTFQSGGNSPNMISASIYDTVTAQYLTTINSWQTPSTPAILQYWNVCDNTIRTGEYVGVMAQCDTANVVFADNFAYTYNITTNYVTGAAAASANFALTGTGSRRFNGSASIGTRSQVRVPPYDLGVSQIQSATTLSAAAIHLVGRQSNLVVDSELIATPFVTRGVRTVLSGVSTLTATGDATPNNHLISGASLVATGLVTHFAQAGITANAIVDFSGGFPFFASMGVRSDSAITAVGRRIRQPVAMMQLASDVSFVPFSITVLFITSKGVPITDITGVVEFYDSGSFIGVSNVDASGIATWIVSTMTVGSHSLYAQYLGDINYFPAQTNAYGHRVKGPAQSYATVFVPTCKSNILINGNYVCVSSS